MMVGQVSRIIRRGPVGLRFWTRLTIWLGMRLRPRRGRIEASGRAIFAIGQPPTLG